MSREIKFRGKCQISGDLVFGDLIHGVGAKSNNVYILPNRINLAVIKHCDPLDGVKVDPETVGQYTGLKDKNDVEIYEGNIVKTPKGISAVTFDLGCFYVKTESRYRLGGWDQDAKEVIGNIYENPELLKP